MWHDTSCREGRHTECGATIWRLRSPLLALLLSTLALDASAQQLLPPREIDPRLGQYEPAPVLRWQHPDLDNSRYGPPFGVRAAGFDEGSDTSGVQFASPLSDPFGDRFAQELNPAAPAEPLTPAPPMSEPGRAAPSPSNRLLEDTRRNAPCDRIYNDRNCCEDEERCREVREFLQRMRITDISVDITPAFRPQSGAFYSPEGGDPLSSEPQGVEDTQAARLALSGPRTWRNRQGQVLAEGRWTDYRYGRVYVSRGEGDVIPIPVHELSNDDLCFINAWWELPSECTLGADPFLGRHFAQTTFTWKASALCHKPLYFEELALERYGHTAGPVFQPIYSGAHFFSSIFFLPYKMGLNPPNECIYQLGLYRPGSCAPWLAEPFPISLRGAALQTGAVLGGVYLLP
jgi:hypothetical protein